MSSLLASSCICKEMNKQTLQDVIHRYELDGLKIDDGHYYGNYSWHGEFSVFPYSSLKDTHKYIKLKLRKKYSRIGEVFFPYESYGTQKTEFTEEEIQFIKSISLNNNKFDVSLLKDSYNYVWGAGDSYRFTIDKKNKKINHFGSEESTLPMPIYINAVSSDDPKFGFFSLYDDLSVLNGYFCVEKKIQGKIFYDEKFKQDFIKDLAGIDGKVFFSFHTLYFGRVLSSQSPGSKESSGLHFFHIKDQQCHAFSSFVDSR